MPDSTTVIPIKTGIAYVEQAAETHSITVICAALNEASALVSNAYSQTVVTNRQEAFREAEECAKVALAYLAAIIKTPSGSRVQWTVGYTEHTGTVVQTMDNGQFMVVPDGAEPVFMFPVECEIIS